jgi:hypothetical protein
MRWDAERFSLLQEIVEGRLHMIMHGYNRRILFNVVRSVQRLFALSVLTWLGYSHLRAAGLLYFVPALLAI